MNSITLKKVTSSLALALLLAMGASERAHASEYASDCLDCTVYETPAGVFVEFFLDGRMRRISAKGEATLMFGDATDLRLARQKAGLRAKAAIARFMEDEIVSQVSVDDMTKTVVQAQRAGSKFRPSAIRETVINQTESISSSTTATLQGAVILEEVVDKDNRVLAVTLGVSPSTVDASRALGRMFKGGTAQNISAPGWLGDPLEDGGVRIRRSPNYGDY